MATKNATITIRKRKVELKLTFEFADHIMYNYINNNKSHPLTFLEIQKAARPGIFYLKKKRTYTGTVNFKGNNFKIVVILDKQNAVLKTCYKL